MHYGGTAKVAGGKIREIDVGGVARIVGDENKGGNIEVGGGIGG